ncbi:hypothetical protein BDV96DRAFT_640321 [Lophiotrema nucula]|uniref:Uncharacterized protein n=1 Tax=Lophiotrema nucula TaxID=690887 RepID=A0A6A5ZTW0_9PLEO|nr:hypothetical protein BDV96DRAFT_640321 [Lophiotrema nucula]
MKLLHIIAAVFSTLTLASLEHSDLLPRGDYTAILTQIENDFVPVGRLTGQDLYDKVYTALDKLCPKGGFADSCITDKVVRIEHIEWDDHSNFKNDGHIDAYVSGNNFPRQHTDVRGALMHQLAAAFMLSTMDSKNCYHDDLKGRGNVYHCNAPRGACVYNSQPELKDTSMLCLHLRPNYTPVKGGSFDCTAVLGAVGDFLRNNKDGVQDEFKSALGASNIWSQERCTNNKVTHIDGSKMKMRRLEEPSHATERSTSETLSLHNGNWFSGEVTATTHDPVLRVRISTGDKVHVGQYKGQALYDAIHDGLHKMCKEEYGQNTCTPNDAASIPNVEYIYRGSVKTDAEVYIQGYKNNFPKNKQGLKDAFIHQVAGTFSVGSEDEKNCFTKKMNGKDYHWCNLPHEVKVWLDTGAIDGSDAFITVHLGFSKGTSMGGCFDCKAIVGRANAFAFDQGPEEEFKKAIGKTDKLDVVVDCFSWDVMCSKNLKTRDDPPALSSAWEPGSPSQIALVDGKWVDGNIADENIFATTSAHDPILRLQVHHNGDNEHTKVHVGQYHSHNDYGDLLYNSIKNALSKQCPEHRLGRETCNPGSMNAIFDDVEYSNESQHLSGDGKLFVGVQANYFPEDKPGLREAFIHLAAAAFKLATDDKKNCWEGYRPEGTSYWCNMPRKINIWLEDKEQPGENWAHIDVFAWFDKFLPGETGGCFDCKAGLGSLHHYATIEGPQADFAEALRIYPSRLSMVMDCADWNVQC